MKQLPKKELLFICTIQVSVTISSVKNTPNGQLKVLIIIAMLNGFPKGITSTFGPYVDEIIIPQLLELAGEYNVDGVWLDGECWGTQVDYNPKVMEIFKDQTGIDISENPPVKPGDEHWQKYSDFCREQFRKYMRHYTDSVHKIYPDFQIASNWSFSSKMPEPVTVNVDFLSGDYLWADSVNSARYEGRCLAPQGKPWDLMAWGFRWRNGDRMEHCPKHPEQLKQEAAVVLALGGGFQSYYPQKKDGSDTYVAGCNYERSC